MHFQVSLFNEILNSIIVSLFICLAVWDNNRVLFEGAILLIVRNWVLWSDRPFMMEDGRFVSEN
jgi:hypothetical protein